MNNGKTEVGSYTVIARFSGDTENYYPIDELTATLSIRPATVVVPEVDLSGISFDGKTVTYNGEVHSLAVSGTLPEGVTVEYENNGKTDAGSYTVVAKFSKDGSYLEGKDMRANLRIERAELDISGISFEDLTVLYNGEAHSIAISGELPLGVTVSYVGNGQIAAGEHTVVAKFNVGKNYAPIADMTATITIIGSAVDLSGITLSDLTVIYDGTEHNLHITGTRPTGVTVEYVGNGQIAVGVYTVTAKFYYNGVYISGSDLTAKLTINQGADALKELVFENKTFVYDGQPKSVEVEGEIPQGFSVYGYEGNGEINAGKYEVRVMFAYEGVHNPEWDMVASYEIKPATLPAIAVADKSVGFDGKEHTIEYVPGTLPEGITVQVIGTPGYLPGTYTFIFGYVIDESVKNNYVKGEDVVATLTITESDYVTGELVYDNVTGGVAVIGYNGNEKVIVIPETHDGKAVVAIAANAFKNNKSIKSVIVPDSVKAIGQGAFAGTLLEEIVVPFIGGSRVTSNDFFGYIFGASEYVANEIYVPVTLKKVTLSDTCTYIPAYSFRSCVSIEEIVIGKGVTEIGISAFEKCTSLGSIYIPANVTDIPAAANYYNSPFFDCGEGFRIYLEAGSVPASGYGAQWNSISSTARAEVITGKTYDSYLADKNA